MFSMTDILDKITQAVVAERQALHDRDAAMRAAREAGHTWRSIAHAAGMTERGVQKALARRNA